MEILTFHNAATFANLASVMDVGVISRLANLASPSWIYVLRGWPELTSVGSTCESATFYKLSRLDWCPFTNHIMQQWFYLKREIFVIPYIF